MKHWVIAAFAAAMMSTAGFAEQRHETVAEGLEYPWSLAFLPDGRMLVTEKPGRLRVIDETGLRAEAISGVPDVLHSGQGGLLDVVLHPDFAANQIIYLTWSEGEARDNTLKLGRGRLEGMALTGFEEIFAAAPRRNTDVHYGARLAFLPDNTLLLGIGDGFDHREEAQRPQTHYGSYVHLNADGSAIDGPFADAAPGVYTIGHRNPQAIAVDPVSGIVYSNEHGPRGGDEINILVEGRNYGWPIATYGIDYNGALVSPYTSYPGMEEPMLYWVPSIAPSSMAVYHGTMFAEWDGDLLVTALISGDAVVASGHLRRIDLEDGEVVDQEVLIGDAEARMRYVGVAPDGSIYVLTDDPEGEMIRLYRD
ncbi:PQQ-dependent sugar dehydrogenase [Maricaulis salignorans]|uniref:Glucose/arabinose dehydrogenase, beta-propeller fold n=1 Tax=Maricaulis salignorans TaxID=144026 RepID=A0A1G9M6B2_9PROT|nr:PQQ-dependent sugar dehydrogenase [Maricaulis salignorans]SDL69491.1 Glucose/arabinose dehydrogenase, beta-propeller fold [Maricaulis salignorans]